MFIQRTINKFSVAHQFEFTPKAFANFSSGLHLSDNHGSGKIDSPTDSAAGQQEQCLFSAPARDVLPLRATNR
jgi:hypothetical protein